MKPIKNNIIVVQDGQPTQTKSGIFINIFGSARQHRPNTGTVEFVGETVTKLKVGDKIFFTQYAGIYFVNDGGEDRILMRDSDALGRFFNDYTEVETFFDPAQFGDMHKGLGINDQE